MVRSDAGGGEDKFQGRTLDGRREVDRQDEWTREAEVKRSETGCHQTQLSLTPRSHSAKKERRKKTKTTQSKGGKNDKLGQSIIDVERQAEERKKKIIRIVESLTPLKARDPSRCDSVWRNLALVNQGRLV